MNHKISIIGLGYVGLPLAVEFAKIYDVVGFDIDLDRVNELNEGCDSTNEVSNKKLNSAINGNLIITNNVSAIEDSNIYIITVPTPIDEYKSPDLKPILSASNLVGKVLKKDDIVIYESTVYPGCTEEDCVPVLESCSNLKYNKDFFCGYSPERINPGDKINTLTNIVKVTSGSNSQTSNIVDKLYKSIIKAGTYKAPSIKVAEASKAIENAQRDLNISFVNELAIIFDQLEIDTSEVIEAASTKWNFLKFKPGLVGGHCIGVDPYYLSYKAQSVGYYPQVILSGRSVNDNMGKFIAQKVVKLLLKRKIPLDSKTKILILGITFKENCPDIRNSKVVDVYNELSTLGLVVDVFDPYASKVEVEKKFKINLCDNLGKYDGIILATAHDEFKKLNFKNLKRNKMAIVYDVKSFLDKKNVTKRL